MKLRQFSEIASHSFDAAIRFSLAIVKYLYYYLDLLRNKIDSFNSISETKENLAR